MISLKIASIFTPRQVQAESVSVAVWMQNNEFRHRLFPARPVT